VALSMSQVTGMGERRVGMELVGNGAARQNGRLGVMSPAGGAASGAVVAAGGPDGQLLAIPQQLQEQLNNSKQAIWMRIGSLRATLDDKNGALAAYETVLAYNPNNHVAMTEAGALLAKLKQFSPAVQYLSRAIEADQNYGEAWAILAHCYVMTDELDRAYHAYQNALRLLSNPRDPHLWYGIGLLYDRYGSLDHALEAFLSVLDISPDFERVAEVCFCIGVIYKEERKEYNEALEYFNRVVNAESVPPPLSRADAFYQIGHIAELKGDFKTAMDTYGVALQENPKHVKTLQQMGWLLQTRNHSEEALKLLRKAADLDSSNGQSWYLIGRVYMALQQYLPAYNSYQEAVLRDPRNPTYWCSIGNLYYKRGQYKDAMDAYMRAISIDPHLSEVWYDLGTLYEACNQPRDAIEAYRTALEGVPDNAQIRARLQRLEQQVSGHAPPPETEVMQPRMMDPQVHVGGGQVQSHFGVVGEGASAGGGLAAVQRHGSTTGRNREGLDNVNEHRAPLVSSSLSRLGSSERVPTTEPGAPGEKQVPSLSPRNTGGIAPLSSLSLAGQNRPKKPDADTKFEPLESTAPGENQSVLKPLHSLTNKASKPGTGLGSLPPLSVAVGDSERLAPVSSSLGEARAAKRSRPPAESDEERAPGGDAAHKAEELPKRKKPAVNEREEAVRKTDDKMETDAAADASEEPPESNSEDEGTPTQPAKMPLDTTSEPRLAAAKPAQQPTAAAPPGDGDDATESEGDDEDDDQDVKMEEKPKEVPKLPSIKEKTGEKVALGERIKRVEPAAEDTEEEEIREKPKEPEREATVLPSIRAHTPEKGAIEEKDKPGAVSLPSLAPLSSIDSKTDVKADIRLPSLSDSKLDAKQDLRTEKSPNAPAAPETGRHEVRPAESRGKKDESVTDEEEEGTVATEEEKKDALDEEANDEREDATEKDAKETAEKEEVKKQDTDKMEVDRTKADREGKEKAESDKGKQLPQLSAHLAMPSGGDSAEASDDGKGADGNEGGEKKLPRLPKIIIKPAKQPSDRRASDEEGDDEPLLPKIKLVKPATPEGEPHQEKSDEKAEIEEDRDNDEMQGSNDGAKEHAISSEADDVSPFEKAAQSESPKQRVTKTVSEDDGMEDEEEEEEGVEDDEDEYQQGEDDEDEDDEDEMIIETRKKSGKLGGSEGGEPLRKSTRSETAAANEMKERKVRSSREYPKDLDEDEGSDVPKREADGTEEDSEGEAPEEKVVDTADKEGTEKDEDEGDLPETKSKERDSRHEGKEELAARKDSGPSGKVLGEGQTSDDEKMDEDKPAARQTDGSGEERESLPSKTGINEAVDADTESPKDEAKSEGRKQTDQEMANDDDEEAEDGEIVDGGKED